MQGSLTVGWGVRLVVVHCTLACLHTGQPHSSCCCDVMAATTLQLCANKMRTGGAGRALKPVLGSLGCAAYEVHFSSGHNLTFGPKVREEAKDILGVTKPR